MIRSMGILGQNRRWELLKSRHYALLGGTALAFSLVFCADLMPYGADAREYTPAVQDCLSRGDAYLKDGRLQDAKFQFEDAIAKDPRCTEAYNSLADLYLRAGLFPQAISALKEIVALEPSSGKAYYKLGEAQYRAGLYDDSINSFSASRDLIGDQGGQLSVALGSVFRDRGLQRSAGRKEDFARAQSYLKEAIKADPNNPAAHYNLGLLLSRLGNKLDAAKEFRLAVQLRPEYAYAYHNLGESEEALGNIPAALIAYFNAYRFEKSKALQEESKAKALRFGVPENCFESLAWAYECLSENKLDEAEEEFQKLTVVPQMAGLAWNNVGFIYSRRANYKEAAKAFERALAESQGGLKEAYYNLAMVKIRLKDFNGADKALKRALESGMKKDALVHNAQGLLAAQKGLHEEALRHYRFAKLQTGTSLHVLDFNEALSLEKLNKLKEAKEAYERYLSKEPAGSLAQKAKTKLKTLKI